jgi:hypothetical protein
MPENPYFFAPMAPTEHVFDALVVHAGNIHVASAPDYAYKVNR